VRPTNLEIAKINRAGGTQVRVAIDQATVDRYAEALSADGKVDAIEIFFDGKDHWPWDGFHRIAAAEKLGLATISAIVRPGSRKDAVWKALSANRKHGKQMTNADKTNAIRLALKEFREKSDRSIAAEIGVADKSVGRLRLEMEATAEIPHSEKTIGKDGIARPSSTSRPKAAGTKSSVADAIDTAAIPFEADPAKPVEPATDLVGTPLRGEKMIEAFGRRAEINALVSTLGEVRDALAQAEQSRDPLYMELSFVAVNAFLTNAQRHLRAISPHAVCPYCRGKGCKSCHERGWVGKDVYTAAPSDSK
jgi:hypothetical protein